LNRIEELASLLRSEELTQTTLADASGVVLDVDTLQVFSLNVTGAFLLDALRDGVTKREELVERLLGEFDVLRATAEEDVEGFLAELSKMLLSSRRKGRDPESK
jgi:hypothetical protein